MPQSPQPPPIETTCEQLQTRLQSADGLVLLDCREEFEHAIARLPDAVLQPMSTLTERFDELSDLRDQPVVVYCHHGVRSLRVAQWLRQQGFSNAQSLAGGIDMWSQTIDPTVPRY